MFLDPRYTGFRNQDNRPKAVGSGGSLHNSTRHTLLRRRLHSLRRCRLCSQSTGSAVSVQIDANGATELQIAKHRWKHPASVASPQLLTHLWLWAKTSPASGAEGYRFESCRTRRRSASTGPKARDRGRPKTTPPRPPPHCLAAVTVPPASLPPAKLSPTPGHHRPKWCSWAITRPPPPYRMSATSSLLNLSEKRLP